MSDIDFELPAVDDDFEDADEFPLASDEKQALERCEEIIRHGITTFIEVGEALAEIRSGKLYRMQFPTFEAYCRDKWGIGGARARQLIGAAGVARHIESVTTVTLSNERQAREIMGLAPDQQVQAAERAVDLAGDRAPTARHFQQAAAEISAPALDLIDLGNILLRLDAHGYAKTGTRQKGMTTFYSFRDFRSDKDDGSAGELELAEGELSFWLAELDDNARRAEQRNAQYLDARDRAERLGYDLKHDGDQFVLSIAGQIQPALRGTLDAQIKTIAGYERTAAKRAAEAPPLPSEDEQHRETVLYLLQEARIKGERTGTRLYQQAYDHAREIHDLALYNKMIALIDRATDTPPAPAAPTLEALEALHETLPADLTKAGYYWQSATPPTIRHNDGWQADAPTVDLALQAARDREQGRSQIAYITIPPFPTKDVSTLLASIAFVLEQWPEKTRGQAAPALGLLRAIGRKTLEATD